MDKTLNERFWDKVNPGAPDECWEWQASRNEKGYGRIGVRVDGKMHPGYAHRASWEIHNGPIPSGMCVLHHCDNPSCVNPDHLFIGYHADNTADMFAKGRNKTPRYTPRDVSGQTRQKMREAKLGGRHHRAMPVTINGRWYDSQATAARGIGVSPSAIRLWLRTGKAKAI